MKHKNIKELRRLYRSNRVVKAICDTFAETERASRDTTVEDVIESGRRLGGSFPRTEVVGALKALASLSFGSLIPGRKGHPTRLEWFVSSVTLGKSARGDSDTVEPLDGAMQGTAAVVSGVRAMREVRYPLPRGREARLMVPWDLASREANSLCDVIRTLIEPDQFAAQGPEQSSAPGRRDHPDLPPMENPELDAFARRCLERGMEYNRPQKRIEFPIADRKRFNLNIRRTKAYVWQTARFNEDLAFWRGRLRTEARLQEKQQGQCLSFYLETGEDFRLFERALSEIRPEWFRGGAR